MVFEVEATGKAFAVGVRFDLCNDSNNISDKYVSYTAKTYQLNLQTQSIKMDVSNNYFSEYDFLLDDDMMEFDILKEQVLKMKKQVFRK